jgi:oligosaccharide repeat unit polymerase
MLNANHTVTEAFFLFLHFFMLWFNYSIFNRKVMHPAVLFAGLWFVVLFIHFVAGFTVLDELLPVSSKTYSILFVGVLFFTAGCFLQTIISEKKESLNRQINYNQPVSDFTINPILSYFLLIVIAAGLPFYIQASYKLFIASQIDNFFVGLRTELTYGGKDIGPVKYFMSFSFVAYAFSIYAMLKEPSRKNKLLFFLTLVITITYAVFATGRTFLFIIFIEYIGVRYAVTRHFSAQKMLRWLAFFVLIFSLIGIIYGKGGSSEGTLSENLEAASETTAIYIASPINALDQEISKAQNTTYDGNNSLQFFIKLINQFTLFPVFKVRNIIQSYVFVPYPTNVYTYYSLYIRDFGPVYAWVLLAFFGFVHCGFHHKAVHGYNVRFVFYYTFLLYPLLLSFFGDQYFSLISTWIQIAIFIELFLLLNRYLNKRSAAKILEELPAKD